MQYSATSCMQPAASAKPVQRSLLHGAWSESSKMHSPAPFVNTTRPTSTAGAPEEAHKLNEPAMVVCISTPTRPLTSSTVEDNTSTAAAKQATLQPQSSWVTVKTAVLVVWWTCKLIWLISSAARSNKGSARAQPESLGLLAQYSARICWQISLSGLSHSGATHGADDGESRVQTDDRSTRSDAIQTLSPSLCAHTRNSPKV
mmetsp:Transcript_69711/g.160200  ORF Transcript_69711/g.160200 Transcript_69711/m.160200 type:complete len:202 (+) Transcript_69711:250-855(+)